MKGLNVVASSQATATTPTAATRAAPRSAEEEGITSTTEYRVRVVDGALSGEAVHGHRLRREALQRRSAGET